MANEKNNILLIPTEIFLLTFEYLSTSDLFHAFYGLDSRVNTIINSIPIKLDKLYDAHTRQYVLPNLNPEQVHELDILHGGNQEIIDIQQFRNVRHLKFYLEPSLEQLNHIQPTYLPHLKRLNIEKLNLSHLSDEYINLCTNIFVGQFRVLKTVKLPHLDCKYIRLSHDWSRILTCLEIVQCTKGAFYMILQNLRYLQTFHATITTNDQHSMTQKHYYLRNLYLETYDDTNRINMNMDEFFSLCTYLPSMECVTISLIYSDTIQNAFRDLNTSFSFCQQLISFDCFIKIQSINLNETNIDQLKRQYRLLQNAQTYIYRCTKFYSCRIRKSYINY